MAEFPGWGIGRLGKLKVMRPPISGSLALTLVIKFYMIPRRKKMFEY